ncbi:hypothetical protein D5S18_03040 [Nocardia panacis]|uniref:Uncharacterized protein n=1 Tax=Nocardia panacis TaxID=2340916 RepID=A0A3A4L8D8_9NOCA|nr:hypothetical protein D5S18_03040 [Nocardia panacis]
MADRKPPSAELADLQAIRRALMDDIDSSRGVGRAQLAKALLDVLERIRELAPPEVQEVTPLDELARRRADRESAAPDTHIAFRKPLRG